MAKSKYTPEIVEIICDAIATEGGDESGWMAGGISHETFYRWIKDRPEFCEVIARARAEYKRNAPASLKRLASERCREQLERGQVIRRKRTITRRLDHYTPSGDLKWYQEETTVQEDEDNLGIQPWAIDRVLPKPPPDIESAIALLEKHGYIVSLPEAQLRELIAQATPETSQERGKLSPSRADEIRTQILGVAEQPADPAPVSGDVVQG